MEFKNSKEALLGVEEDYRQGSDLNIIKPALSYMDIIKNVNENFNIPIVAYNVSGEYSMVKAASKNGWIDEKKIVFEVKRGSNPELIQMFNDGLQKIKDNGKYHEIIQKYIGDGTFGYGN